MTTAACSIGGCADAGISGYLPACSQRRTERERERDDADVGIARVHELRGLRDVLAQTSLRWTRVVDLLVPQRGHCGPAVRCELRVGDRDPLDARIAQAAQPALDVDAGVLPRPQHDASGRVLVEARRVGVSRRRSVAADSRCRRRDRRRTARRSGSARRSCRTIRTRRSRWRGHHARMLLMSPGSAACRSDAAATVRVRGVADCAAGRGEPAATIVAMTRHTLTRRAAVWLGYTDGRLKRFKAFTMHDSSRFIHSGVRLLMLLLAGLRPLRTLRSRSPPGRRHA